jgi:hypothetical protein
MKSTMMAPCAGTVSAWWRGCLIMTPASPEKQQPGSSTRFHRSSGIKVMGKIARSMIFCIFNDEKSKRNKRNATRKLYGLVKTGKFVVWQRQAKHWLIKLRSEFVPKDRKVHELVFMAHGLESTGKSIDWESVG